MDFRKMDEFLDMLTAWRIPGNDCKIIKDGKVIYRHQSGWSDREAGRKMQGSELYNMWSCTKPITAAAALTLLEKGLFTMSEPISKYIPEFENMKVKVCKEDGSVDLVDANKPITFQHIMTMSAGFEYNLDTAAIGEVRKKTDGRCPTVDIVRAIASQNLNFHPGEGWAYSNCYDILGGLIEVISGMKFGEYVKKTIFEPLGMNNSFIGYADDEMKKKLCRQYSFNDADEKSVPTDNSNGFVLGPEYESGGAGLVSTVDDCSEFAYMLASGGTGRNGAKILSPFTVELMRMPHIPNGVIEKTFRYMNGYGYGYGVRTMADRVKGGSIGPLGEFGWAGAAGAYFLIDPDNKLSMFYCEHQLGSQEDFFLPRIRNVLYGCL